MKTISMEYGEYKDELNKKYAEGYGKSLVNVAWYLIKNDKSNAEIYYDAISSYCDENELLEYLDAIDNLCRLHKINILEE